MKNIPNSSITHNNFLKKSLEKQEINALLINNKKIVR